MSGTNNPAPALSRTIVLPVPDPPMDLVLPWPPKSPGTIQDYSLDVSVWAEEQGETITGFQALVSLPGSTVSPLTAVQKPLVAGSNVCTVILSAGVSATQCAVTFVVTTATRQLTFTCWIVVVSLPGVTNRFGGISYIGSALDPATAGQFAALNALLATETQARILADTLLQKQIGQAAVTAGEAVAQAQSTQGSLSALETQFHDFEQEVEQQLLALSGSGGGGETVISDGTVDVTPPAEGSNTATIGLKATGVVAGTYAGLTFDEYGRFIGLAVAPAPAGVFLVTEAGQFIAVEGGAANTFLGVNVASTTGTSSSLILTETGAGNLLAEDGVTPLSMEAN